MTMPRKQRLLAISSGGGHWVQLLRLRPAFGGCDITYATVRRDYRVDVSDGTFMRIADCNRSHKLKLLWSAITIFVVVARVQPRRRGVNRRCSWLLRATLREVVRGKNHLGRQHRQRGTSVDVWRQGWSDRAVVADAVVAPREGAGTVVSRERPMILVTVGTDGPFDRLVAAVDQWAGESGRSDVIAQIGRSRFKPRFMRFHEFLTPVQFSELFTKADLVIAHAGMGTILSALRYQRPLIVMPRRASLGEQRNEHQLATAQHLMEMGRVTVAADEQALRARLENLDQLMTPLTLIGAYAEPRLIQAIKTFIDSPRGCG